MTDRLKFAVPIREGRRSNAVPDALPRQLRPTLSGRIECQREGRVHEYTRKQGIEETFILTPKDAPDWATDRSHL